MEQTIFGLSCRDQLGRTRQLRSIQGHCGGVHIDPKNSKYNDQIPKDGQITVVTLDLHWTTGPYPKEDLLLEELRLKKEERRCFFTAVNLLSDSMHTFRVEEVKNQGSFLTPGDGEGRTTQVIGLIYSSRRTNYWYFDKGSKRQHAV